MNLQKICSIIITVFTKSYTARIIFQLALGQNFKGPLPLMVEASSLLDLVFPKARRCLYFLHIPGQASYWSTHKVLVSCPHRETLELRWGRNGLCSGKEGVSLVTNIFYSL